MDENAIYGHVLTAAFTVHTALGAGLFERAYQLALAHELRKAGLQVEEEVAVQVLYDGVALGTAYRMDMLVEGKVVIELKSVETLVLAHFKQLTNYLRLSGHRLGVLINFNVPALRDHIHRVANGL